MVPDETDGGQPFFGRMPPCTPGIRLRSESNHTLEAARKLDAAGRREEALAAFRDFLEHCPESIDGWVDYGGLLIVLGRLDLAEAACDRALRLDPDHYGALAHSACVQMHQGRLDASEGLFQKAIAADPKRIAGRLMLSDCLVQKGDLPRARVLLEGILAQEPANQMALDRLNTLMARQGDWPGLRRDMERQLLPYSGAEAEYVAGHLDLMFGDMPRGWDRSESRLKIPGRQPPRPYPQPHWKGESFVGKTLLLTWEQGFGDTLMFLRYAPLAKALGGRVLVEVQPPLAELAATCAGIDGVTTPGPTLPGFDLHASLLSLPSIFRTRLDTIPADVPYLMHPGTVPARERIDRALVASQDKVRVALCWAGNANHPKDAKRSLPPAVLAPLGALPGVAWHSFQYEAVRETPLPDLLTLGDLLKGFPNTAYALSKMDLVITVDTVLAHLAVAMGIPTFLLLSFIPDWRWMLGREDSPWYPTVRLYRQFVPGDWGSVVLKVLSDLMAEE